MAEWGQLTPVSEGSYVHTTYFNYNGAPTPSNGLVITTKKGLIMVDTPWTPEQTEDLIKSVEKQLGSKFVLAIITHWHQDRIGGIEVLRKHKIKTISSPLTAELAAKAGYLRPEARLGKEVQLLKVGGTDVECYYPGPAHSKDNGVVYLPQAKILFGGCIVKAVEATNLGNVADGDPVNYGAAVKNLIKRYPNAAYVIPGHGRWGGPELLAHTLELAEPK